MALRFSVKKWLAWVTAMSRPRPVNGTPCILLGSIFYGGVFLFPVSSMSW